MDVNALLALSESEFQNLVDQEVRRIPQVKNPQLDALAKALRDPRLADRWYYALINMKKSVESQLGSKRADMAEKTAGRKPEEMTRVQNHDKTEYLTVHEVLTDYHRWKAGALRFKNGVESRLLEIKAQRLHYYPDAETLTEGIRRHQRTVMKEYESDVSDADEMLWELVSDRPGAG